MRGLGFALARRSLVRRYTLCAAGSARQGGGRAAALAGVVPGWVGGGRPGCRRVHSAAGARGRGGLLLTADCVLVVARSLGLSRGRITVAPLPLS